MLAALTEPVTSRLSLAPMLMVPLSSALAAALLAPFRLSDDALSACSVPVPVTARGDGERAPAGFDAPGARNRLVHETGADKHPTACHRNRPRLKLAAGDLHDAGAANGDRAADREGVAADLDGATVRHRGRGVGRSIEHERPPEVRLHRAGAGDLVGDGKRAAIFFDQAGSRHRIVHGAETEQHAARPEHERSRLEGAAVQLQPAVHRGRAGDREVVARTEAHRAVVGHRLDGVAASVEREHGAAVRHHRSRAGEVAAGGEGIVGAELDDTVVHHRAGRVRRSVQVQRPPLLICSRPVPVASPLTVRV